MTWKIIQYTCPIILLYFVIPTVFGQPQERTDEEFRSAFQEFETQRENINQLANIAELCGMFAKMNNVEEVWNCVYHARDYNSKIGSVIENYKNKNYSNYEKIN